MEGRGRSRRDYPSRSEEKSHRDRGGNPPSRHLWVGNLSHSLTERALAHHFLQFGELESLAFPQGRCYAFVNYRNEEDAFAAIKELQGFSLEGNPLRIEFAKAEKSLASSREERLDEQHSRARGSPFPQRDSRDHRSSSELSHHSKSKMNDKNAEPSEVLWIGFPAPLKVDEFILRRAFSPFGEIEKITAFPGRTYAFVRFRKVMAACRAKETLQGKLFGNPRVHICFARSESGTSNRWRDSSPSPRDGPYGHTGSLEHFQSDRNYDSISEDHSARSPYSSRMDEANTYGLARDRTLWSGGEDVLDRRRYPGQRSEKLLHYDHPNSPPRNTGVRMREFSPPVYSRQGPIYDEPWDLPEDVSLLHGTKKHKTNTFPTENELPEYPFSDLEKANRILPYDIPQSGANYDPRQSGYRPVSERLMNKAPTQPYREKDDHWHAPHDEFKVGSVPLLVADRRRLTPDLQESSPKEVWKWEGMIAKGGNPICRARCFPVGKPPDMVLPEYLDCTARTTLDMLAKHYYQAASAWVVFFAPANDPDISYYNQFMNYLGEKERAAVVKLDEGTTLFLVPPSEFSEKVLKVPGKLSISGVVLRLDPPGSSHGSLPQYDNRETPYPSFQNDLGYQKQVLPSATYMPASPFTNYERPGNMSVAAVPAVAATHSMNNMQSVDTLGHDYVRKPAAEPNWASPHDLHNSEVIGKTHTSPPTNPPIGSMDHPYTAMSRTMQEATHHNYTPDMSGIPLGGNGKFLAPEKLPVPSSMSLAGLPAEQVAQLASSLLGQQGQLGGMSSAGEYKPPSGNINQSGHSFNMVAPPNYGLPNEQLSSEYPLSQFNQMQQLQHQQQQQNVAVAQRDAQAAGVQMNQQLPITGQDDSEGDPQKRLQATLQLAAALLQQIQHGKGN